MWEEIMVLNGTIEDKDGGKLNEDKLFKLLIDNGYQYQGGYETVKRQNLNEGVQDIVDSIDYNLFLKMVDEINKMYSNMDSNDIIYFFESSFGTGSFDRVFDCVLVDDLRGTYKKYTNTNWEVSDEFGSLLGSAIVEKFRDQLK